MDVASVSPSLDPCLALSPYTLLFKSLSLIPIHHYLLCLLLISLVFLYNFLEIHFLRHLISAFRGDPVSLTFGSDSQLYKSVAAKCQVLHGRFSPTPWLSSPHLITAYLSCLAKAPDFTYKRQIFRTSDGGTIALDWLMHSDGWLSIYAVTCFRNQICPANIHFNFDVMYFSVKGGVSDVSDADKTPIMIVVPGLTSDSDSAYIKHLVLKTVKGGWNVVVCNHRGLGGVSITSDCFYNGGWTEDIRKVIDHICSQYPQAPLYAVGTSLGANMLVKYLGEEGVNTPLIGAAAVCPPWDLLICDRYINRRVIQRLYDRVLAVGLKTYAKLHQSILSRLTDWNSIEQSYSVRHFDTHATRVLAKFETVDTYYRRSSCVNFIGNVAVPLLGISALDDPVCSKEAIPCDECRANENIILATTKHGGHLAYFEGITANSLWWVRAVDEFFHVLDSSPLRNRIKVQNSLLKSPGIAVPLESSIDQAPYVNVTDDGMVTAVGSCGQDNIEESMHNEGIEHMKEDENIICTTEKNNDMISEEMGTENLKEASDQNRDALILPVKKRLDRLSRYSRNSIWLLAYIAIVTTWPVVGSALVVFLKKRLRNLIPTVVRR